MGLTPSGPHDGHPHRRHRSAVRVPRRRRHERRRGRHPLQKVRHEEGRPASPTWDMICETPGSAARPRRHGRLRAASRCWGHTPPSWAAWTSSPSPLASAVCGAYVAKLANLARRREKIRRLRRTRFAPATARHFRPRLDGDRLRLPDQRGSDRPPGDLRLILRGHHGAGVSTWAGLRHIVA